MSCGEGINIQAKLTETANKLERMMDENINVDPKTALAAAKEYRGYLSELHSITRGRDDTDDVEFQLIMNVTKAVAKIGFVPRNSSGSKRRGFRGSEREPGLLESGEVRESRAEIPEEPEAEPDSFESYIESGPSFGLRTARDTR